MKRVLSMSLVLQELQRSTRLIGHQSTRSVKYRKPMLRDEDHSPRFLSSAHSERLLSIGHNHDQRLKARLCSATRWEALRSCRKVLKIWVISKHLELWLNLPCWPTSQHLIIHLVCRPLEAKVSMIAENQVKSKLAKLILRTRKSVLQSIRSKKLNLSQGKAKKKLHTWHHLIREPEQRRKRPKPNQSNGQRNDDL